MRQSSGNGQKREIVLLLGVLATFLLASPFFEWWLDVTSHWYFPYLLWGSVILLSGLIQYLLRRNEF